MCYVESSGIKLIRMRLCAKKVILYLRDNFIFAQPITFKAKEKEDMVCVICKE